MFFQFGNCFKEYLLHGILRRNIVFQVFHAHAKQQKRVSLQQDAQPLAVAVRLISCKQFIICNMLVFICWHNIKIVFCGRFHNQSKKYFLLHDMPFHFEARI